jgi:hypothetical protein
VKADLRSLSWLMGGATRILPQIPGHCEVDDFSAADTMPRNMNENSFDPTTIVLVQLNQRLGRIPFKPFVIVMSNGDRHAVPTPDHLTITRLLRRIELETDEPKCVEINPLHVASIEDHQDAA